MNPAWSVRLLEDQVVLEALAVWQQPARQWRAGNLGNLQRLANSFASNWWWLTDLMNSNEIYISEWFWLFRISYKGQGKSQSKLMVLMVVAVLCKMRGINLQCPAWPSLAKVVEPHPVHSYLIKYLLIVWILYWYKQPIRIDSLCLFRVEFMHEFQFLNVLSHTRQKNSLRKHSKLMTLEARCHILHQHEGTTDGANVGLDMIETAGPPTSSCHQLGGSFGGSGRFLASLLGFDLLLRLTCQKNI